MPTNSDNPTGTVSRRRFLGGTAGAAATIAIAGCTESGSGGGDGGSDGKLSGDITVTGSSTVYPLATAIANKFQKKHSKVNITVNRTGSGAGFSNHFCVGNADFNNASRPITKEEKQLCKKNNVKWHELKVATDALTVIVNKDNDWVDCMTVDELRQIWKKNPAQKWSDVNDDWPDKKIERFGAADTSGTFDYFKEAVLGEDTAHTTSYEATEKDNLILQGVQKEKHAIGYFGYAYYQDNKSSVKALGIDNGDGCVKPSLKTAKNGSYKPLARPLFTYPSKEAMKEKHKAEFARFFLEQSTNKKLVADKIGYVPNTEDTKKQELKDLNDFIKKANGN